MITREEMHQHIMNLISQYDLDYEYCRRPTEALAVYQLELVRIAPIRSVISYATALHEIGHIEGRFQRSPDHMVRERWAWRWAHQNALIWTQAMEELRRQSLGFAERARPAWRHYELRHGLQKATKAKGEPMTKEDADYCPVGSIRPAR